MYDKRIIVMFLIGCSLFLTHCTRIMPESHRGASQKIASPYTMPSAAYLALAQNQTGQERQALQVMAAGRAIYDGQWREGLSILNRVGRLTGDLADQKNILLAKVGLMRNQEHAAITQLADVRNLGRLSLFYQAQYHDMLAYAYQHTGASVEAVLERIKLDFILPDEVSKTNNLRALWLVLTKLSQPELDTLLAENADSPILQGWVALADISRKAYLDPHDMLNELQRWQTTYATHPALKILPKKLDTSSLQLLAAPKRMALMLPLTGALAGPGHAIQDGFMDAYRASGKTRQVRIRVYNTDRAVVDQVYQRALEEGADYVVGPLTKADVALVARMSHPVPTLLLNDTDQTLDGLGFQFGLSPTNEAKQVAVKARRAGYTRALIISPAGSWGADVVHAFSEQWTDNRGQIVEAWQYGPQDNLSEGIRKLLRASEYAAKIKPTQTNRRGSEDNASKRRHDFDVVILIAYPSKARQIMPLLRYYFAGDVPIYATSTVYSGSQNTAKDRDLNGVIFCDMPWVLSHPMNGEQHHWAEQLNSYNRLYALGMDSYTLANQLNRLMLFPALGIDDKSGVIYLTPAHQLARILEFGQFKDGLVHKLESAQN